MVAMVTNTVERGQQKCEQYWPEERTKEYGPFNATLADQQVHAVWQSWREPTEGDTVPLHLLARPQCSRVCWSNPQLPQSNEGPDEALQGTNTGSLQVSFGQKWRASESKCIGNVHC